MNSSQYRVGFIGFGHMAQVLFEAIDKARLIPHSHVQFLRRDPAKMKENEQKFKITATSLEHLVRTSDLLFLCVRPQQMPEVLLQLKAIGSLEKKWIISIVSGVSVDAIRQGLGGKGEILRAMPNIASAVNEGMTTLSFAPECSAEFRSLSKILFGAMGQIAEIQESHMDIAVGVSGSGPGFVFRLIEAMARAGEKQGLPYDVALKMAAQTFIGAGKLIAAGHAPRDLIIQIATPNGTTQAGLEMMSKMEIDRHFQAVIDAAAHRSKELGRLS